MVQRWRSVVAWLRHTAPPAPRLTPWGWTADGILAVLLTIAAVDRAMQAQDDPRNVIEPIIVGAPYAPLAPIPPMLPGSVHVQWSVFVLAALTTLPLLTRRRFPLLSFLIIAVATARLELEGAEFTWSVLAVLIAAYSAGTYSRYRNLALVCIVLVAILIIGGNGDNVPTGPLIFLLAVAGRPGCQRGTHLASAGPDPAAGTRGRHPARAGAGARPSRPRTA